MNRKFSGVNFWDIDRDLRTGGPRAIHMSRARAKQSFVASRDYLPQPPTRTASVQRNSSAKKHTLTQKKKPKRFDSYSSVTIFFSYSQCEFIHENSK